MKSTVDDIQVLANIPLDLNADKVLKQLRLRSENRRIKEIVGELIEVVVPIAKPRAIYKIASRWSDGITGELKTYGLTCEKCLLKWFQRSLEKQKLCRQASHETLGPVGIYRLGDHQRDAELQRLPDLEHQLLTSIQT